MTSTLVARQARVTVTIGSDDGTFADTAKGLDANESVASAATGATTSSGLTVYTWTQNRMIIRVSIGGKQFNTAELMVFGLPLATLNALSRLWLTPMNVRPQDTLKIETWDGSQYVPLFFGSITWAAPRGNSMPQVPIVISSTASMALAQSAAQPYSASGTLVLTDVLTNILGASGYTLNAAQSLPAYTITNPRATGSLQDQVKSILDGYPNIAWYFNLQQLILRPVGASIYADPIAIGPTTGMKGSPEYSTSGVQVDTIYEPRLIPGQSIKLDTVFTYAATANWSIAAVEHNLEPNVPNGRWDTRLVAQGISNVNGTGTAS